MCVGKIGLYSCPHCSVDCLLMWRSFFFLSTFLFFSLNLFSARHYKPEYLRTIKFSFGLCDAKIEASVVHVVSNSYIIYYRLFCSWIYVRSMESVFITFFPPLPFLGCCVMEALHYTTLHWNICKRFGPESLLYTKYHQGPYLASLHWCPGLLPVCSKISFVDFFLLPPTIRLFSYIFKKSKWNLYKYFSSNFLQCSSTEGDLYHGRIKKPSYMQVSCLLAS